MIVLAPAGVREKIDEVVHVDLTTVDFGDPGVRFVTVPGTGAREQRSSWKRRAVRLW